MREYRIGVFGGTFDPIHCGHLTAAAAARDALDLDQVLLVVANDPWKKWSRQITSVTDRMAMVVAAAAGEDRLVASDLEIARGGVSYTVDTLEQLAEARPGARLYLLVGADVLGEMEGWDRAERLEELATVVVITRPGGSAPPEAIDRWSATVVPAQTPDVSSTELREVIAAGGRVEGLLPPEVAAIIAERGLYGARRKLLRP